MDVLGSRSQRTTSKVCFSWVYLPHMQPMFLESQEVPSTGGCKSTICQSGACTPPMTDDALDMEVRAIKSRLPHAGYQIVKGCLKVEGNRVQWTRIKASICIELIQKASYQECQAWAVCENTLFKAHMFCSTQTPIINSSGVFITLEYRMTKNIYRWITFLFCAELSSAFFF